MDQPRWFAAEVGDCFCLCDAGGGTVDLISYKVTQINPVVRIEEAVKGTGDKCGASYIDREFLSWLKGWIGQDAYKQIPAWRTRYGSRLMNTFEIAKFGFTGEEDGLVTLPAECGIDSDPEKNIEDRELLIPSETMREIFDPCVTRVLELIDGQVKAVADACGKKPKSLEVLDGMTTSIQESQITVMRKALGQEDRHFRKSRSVLTQVPFINHGPRWSAVVRGAVCRGLEGESAGLIAVRIARKHYGTPTSRPFIEGVHHPDDAYIDRFSGKRYARGQMDWLVLSGERLSEDVPRKVHIDVCVEFRENEEREFAAHLVGCDADNAPRRFADKSAYVICQVRADLSSVPLGKFTRIKNRPDVEAYYVAEFRLQATFRNGVVEWSFIFDGKEYASVSVSYDK